MEELQAQQLKADTDLGLKPNMAETVICARAKEHPLLPKSLQVTQ